MHGPDPMRVADDTWLFKLLVRRLARSHGLAATFMAKPYAGVAGSGLHMHASLMNRDGCNVFDDGGPAGSDMLRHAIGGVLAALPDSTLIFAPHANSYERLVPHSHAPTGVCWAYENRTASVRVPVGPPAARRLEHRVAGGDVNPYLHITAILGAMLIGIEDRITPPGPVTGDAYAQHLPQIPGTWADAMEALEQSTLMPRIFPPMLIDNLLRTKRQEMAGVAKMDAQDVLDLYLEAV